jgi:hypothetical protein
METVITRDTDIIREYLAALDARERGISPFARLAATVKLERLRRELNTAQLETTDEDLSALRREVDERLGRTFWRRFEANPWGARLSIFLMLVLGQQIAIALWMLATMLFVKFAPTPGWWNPVLPHEEPIFLYVFLFLFLFVTPMLALLVVFGGRYFRSWRRTLPATLIIFVLAVLGSYIVTRGKLNTVQRSSSVTQLARLRGLQSTESYRQWVDANWLMKDPRFQRDYEAYLRKGPGRWITSRFDARNDAAWRDSLPVINEYLDGGQDPDSFREWLKYYLDRNRIYSEDRIDQEVAQVTGEANQPFLGIWQVEPYLKERDERSYKAYLGSINRSAKLWGLLSLALLSVVFLTIYLTGPVLSLWERASISRRSRSKQSASDSFDTEPRPERASSRSTDRQYWFPERRDITSMPFFDAPFEILSRVHRSFLRLAVFAALAVFLFWALVWTVGLARGRENAPSQVALMRSNLLFGGPADESVEPDSDLIAEANDDRQNLAYSALADPSQAETLRRDAMTREVLLAARVAELERRLDENEYASGKKMKEQSSTIAGQTAEIDLLKGLAEQLQQTTSAMPAQIADVGSRASAVEARAGDALGQIAGVRQKTESLEGQVGKIDQLETRAARVAEQVGKVEDQASALATRTEALEKELDRRAGQIEARTEELGERTASLKEREEQFDRLQRAAFAAILSDIETDVEDLDRRTRSSFYRLFKKDEARRESEAIGSRITSLLSLMREARGEQIGKLVEQLEEIGRRVEQVSARVK